MCEVFCKKVVNTRFNQMFCSNGKNVTDYGLEVDAFQAIAIMAGICGLYPCNSVSSVN